MPSPERDRVGRDGERRERKDREHHKGTHGDGDRPGAPHHPCRGRAEHRRNEQPR